MHGGQSTIASPPPSLNLIRFPSSILGPININPSNTTMNPNPKASNVPEAKVSQVIGAVNQCGQVVTIPVSEA